MPPLGHTTEQNFYIYNMPQWHAVKLYSVFVQMGPQQSEHGNHLLSAKQTKSDPTINEYGKAAYTGVHIEPADKCRSFSFLFF